MASGYSMGRVANGLDSHGTVNSATLTIAFMEFLMEGDSNMMKSWWLRQGWKDISPMWGERPTVPSFKDQPAMIERWPEFQQQMMEVEADWYYLSGHHGTQFESDYSMYGINQMLNKGQHIGFFNEPYHRGPYNRASQESPNVGRSNQDVFMLTSRDAWVQAPGIEDNPLYSAPHEQCKGVLLVGCNTLVFRYDRLMYKQYFPNAVVIGAFSREANAIGRIMTMAQRYGRSFFIDPRSVDPHELCDSLNPFVGTVDRMAVQRDGILYFKGKSREIVEVAAEEPITDDILRR